MPLSADPDKRAAQLANLRRGNPAPQGNVRRLTHGAYSGQALEPLREQMARDLRTDYPALDSRRLAILADRLARMESARRWLDTRAGVVRNAKGEPWPVVGLVETWAKQAEAILADLEREQAKHGRFSAYQAVVEGTGSDE